MITIEMEIVKKLINHEIQIESVDENAFFRTLMVLRI